MLVLPYKKGTSFIHARIKVIRKMKREACITAHGRRLPHPRWGYKAWSKCVPVNRPKYDQKNLFTIIHLAGFGPIGPSGPSGPSNSKFHWTFILKGVLLLKLNLPLIYLDQLDQSSTTLILPQFLTVFTWTKAWTKV